ncbi:MAG: hypothetical protein ABI620_03150 [Chloroflexota bacterium]
MHVPSLRLAIVPALAALAAVVLLAQPSGVLASCRQPPDVKTAVNTADIVFVGTVTATTNSNSWATVSVEEIWRGPDQAAEVVIRGGPGGNSATSVDRAFEVGVKYLFFPYVDAAVGLSDNSCTSTTPWSEDLAALRPTDARAVTSALPVQTGFDFGGLLGPLAVAVVVAGVLLGVGLLARSRQPG